jgi:hypothetical protein
LAARVLLVLRIWPNRCGFLVIRFYTHNIGPGELAQFAVQIKAPWGDRHIARGSIIQSTKPGCEGMPAVVWPHMSTRLAIYADSPEDGRTAANWILAKWREWVNRDQVRMEL